MLVLLKKSHPSRLCGVLLGIGSTGFLRTFYAQSIQILKSCTAAPLLPARKMAGSSSEAMSIYRALLRYGMTGSIELTVESYFKLTFPWFIAVHMLNNFLDYAGSKYPNYNVREYAPLPIGL